MAEKGGEGGEGEGQVGLRVAPLSSPPLPATLLVYQVAS